MKPNRKNNSPEGPILEEINGKFTLLVEGFGSLNSRMEHIEDDLAVFRNEMNYKFEAAFEHIQHIENRMKRIEEIVLAR